MLSTEIPILYYFLKDWLNLEARKRWMRMGIVVGLVELGAFAAAILIWILQVTCYALSAGWNTEDIWTATFGTVARRTGIGTKKMLETVMVNNETIKSVSQDRWKVTKDYLINSRVLGDLQVRGVITLFAVVTLLYGRLGRRSAGTCVREIIFVVACTLPPISWYYLASAHSYVHVHINYLLWGYPFLPFVTAFLARQIFQCAQLLLRETAAPQAVKEG